MRNEIRKNNINYFYNGKYLCIFFRQLMGVDLQTTVNNFELKNLGKLRQNMSIKILGSKFLIAKSY